MPPTTAYSFGDVVLVPFPFTDQSGSKKRPAVIVSSDEYQTQRRDLVIMAITSQIRPRPSSPCSSRSSGGWSSRGSGQLQRQDIRSLRTSLDQILG
jgi:mRNA interferase MazF